MSKEDSPAPPRKAGRPRSEKARAAALAAAYAILKEKGFARVTVEAVASRAGIGKPTIYRHWANARELAMAALMAHGAIQPGKPAQDTADDDPVIALENQLVAMTARFATPAGRQVALMVAAADSSSELTKSFRNQVIGQSRETARALLARAVETGRLRADFDMEVALDLLHGPIFYRLLVGHLPLDEGFCRKLISACLHGLEFG